MATKENTKAAKRWQMFCNGYSRIWYFRTTIRWIMLATAVSDLISFGVSCAQLESETSYPDGLGFQWLSIIAPLISLFICAAALALLFSIRKGVFINPAWLLSGDTLAGCLLTMDLSLTALDEWNYWRGDSGNINWTPEKLLEVSWGLNLALLLMHFVFWMLEIFEVNTYRRLIRGSNMNSTFDKSEDLENGNDDDDQGTYVAPESVELRNINTQKEPVVKVDMSNTFRIEMPDGRIFELPEGCRIEMPDGSQAELPASGRGLGLRVSTALPELESPTSSKQLWERSPVSTESY